MDIANIVEVTLSKPVLLLVPLWVAIFVMLAGWGLLLVWLLRRLGGSAFGGALTTFQTMWLGYAGVIGFLQLSSIVLRIAGVTLILAWIIALAGFGLHWKLVVRRIRGLRARPRLFAVTAIVLILTSLVVAYAACETVLWFDTGLYHLQVVQWNATYPAVPGLANLHLRFGYNNSVHAFGALIDAYWQGVAAHIVNGFLVTALLGQWFAEIFSARSPRGRLRQVFCMMTLPLILQRVWTVEIASLSTDIALTVFSFVAMLELISLQISLQRLLPLALVLALGAVAVSTKLGGLSLCAVVFVYGLWIIRRAGRRTWVIAFALPLVIVIGWMVHGAIISGWLVFPVFGRLPVEWAVPAELAHDHLRQIESWGHMFGHEADEVFTHGTWYWLGPWLDVFRQSREFVLFVAASALLAWRAIHGPPPAWRPSIWVAVISVGLGITQWFVGAPDLRYGAYLFWLLPAVLFAPMIAGAMRDPTSRLLVLVLSLVLTHWGGGFAFHLDTSVPSPFGRPRYPMTPLTWLRDLGPGLQVKEPQTGMNAQCWDVELPCSPTISTQRLRDPDSLSSGFLP